MTHGGTDFQPNYMKVSSNLPSLRSISKKGNAQ